MVSQTDESLIKELWQEHLAAPFPVDSRGKDSDGVDFVMLDADIAGCVDAYVGGGKLSTYQMAMLGLSYRDVGRVLPVLNEEGRKYFRRLERLAELVLKQIARKSRSA